MRRDYWTYTLQRIEERVHEDAETGCWLWLARSSRNGYGRISVHGKEVQAHRVAWALEHGPIPDGFVLDHLCRNHACVNPAHLDLVTVRVNTLRGEGPTARRWAGNEPQGVGDCFEVAAMLVADPVDAIPGTVLVHGRPRLQRAPYQHFEHAWVERDEMVIDRSNGRSISMPRAVYYAIGHIDPGACRRYSAQEARRCLVSFRHFGPWHGPEAAAPLPMDDPRDA